MFDYEGKSLRNLTVEFEVTKEPEGTRVFYQEPTKIKSGTVNGVVDFSKLGAETILQENISNLHKMADALMKWGAIDEDQIDDLMTGIEPRPP